MVLENFLADADILWDRAGKKLFEKPEARTGRIMRVQVTNRGVVEDLTGYTLNLGWTSTKDETKIGLDAFEAADITKGIFELEYTSGMLTNIGTLKATLQLVPVAGNTVESDNFVITVTKSAVDAAAVQSETSFTALASALVSVNDWNARIDAVEADFIQRANDMEATYPQELLSLGSQLAEKANQVEVETDLSKKRDNTTPLMLADLHTEVKSAMTGGSVAVVGFDAVGSENIKTGAVTKDKIAGMQIIKNMLNPDLFLGGFQLSQAGGHTSGAMYTLTTEFMSVISNSYYALSGSNGTRRVSFYDVNKVHISQITDGATISFIVPSNALYVKVSFPTADKNKIQLEKGNVSTTYASYKFTLKDLVADVSDKSITTEKLADKTITLDKLATLEVPNNRNLIVKKTVANGYQLNNSGGTTTYQATDKSATDFIEVSENTSYYFSNIDGNATFALRVNFYDASEVFLSTVINTNLVTPPTNSKFLRITFYSNQLDTAIFQLGTSRTEIKPPVLKGIRTEGEETFSFDLEEIKGKLGTEKVISCWGDSLTAGAGGTPFPTTLQSLVGTDVTVNNFGVGGENSKTIAARQGGVPMIVDPFTIPSSGPVTVTFKNYDDNTVTPGLQHGFRGVNPCTINGIEGNLSLSSGVYSFTRLTSGGAVEVNIPTPIITDAMKNNRDDIVVIWIGQNDGVNDATEIIRLEKLMIDYLTSYNKQYLILGLSSSSEEYRTQMEQQFKREFGRRFINTREYLSKYGLNDSGITPTEQDLTDMALGKVPISLRIDSVHLNTAGYTVLANLVNKRLVEFGMI